MSTKKIRPSQPSKTTKDGRETESRKPVTQRAVLDAPLPELCPQGGDHEWMDDECNKCHEPKPQIVAPGSSEPDGGAAAQSTGKPKGTKKAAKSLKVASVPEPKKLSAVNAAVPVNCPQGGRTRVGGRRMQQVPRAGVNSDYDHPARGCPVPREVGRQARLREGVRD